MTRNGLFCLEDFRILGSDFFLNPNKTFESVFFRMVSRWLLTWVSYCLSEVIYSLREWLIWSLEVIYDWRLLIQSRNFCSFYFCLSYMKVSLLRRVFMTRFDDYGLFLDWILEAGLMVESIFNSSECYWLECFIIEVWLDGLDGGFFNLIWIRIKKWWVSVFWTIMVLFLVISSGSLLIRFLTHLF